MTGYTRGHPTGDEDGAAMTDAEVRRLLAILEADNTTAPAAGEPWPCTICNNPGVRNLGRNGYCAVHLGELYATFDPAVFAETGLGLQDGPARPEWGPLYFDLRCIRCDATWTGVPGDPCWWCCRSAEIMRDHQAELLLTPPDVDPDDTRYAVRMEAWAQRMAVGTKAGLITRDQAYTAWRRATKKAAA